LSVTRLPSSDDDDWLSTSFYFYFVLLLLLRPRQVDHGGEPHPPGATPYRSPLLEVEVSHLRASPRLTDLVPVDPRFRGGFTLG
jgi:hypothetical protein